MTGGGVVKEDDSDVERSGPSDQKRKMMKGEKTKKGRKRKSWNSQR